jgi:hypothetical protein
MIRKRKGESGQPCFRPFMTLKKRGGEPWMRIANVALSKHPMIELTIFVVIPIFRRANLRKF